MPYVVRFISLKLQYPSSASAASSLCGSSNKSISVFKVVTQRLPTLFSELSNSIPLKLALNYLQCAIKGYHSLYQIFNLKKSSLIVNGKMIGLNTNKQVRVWLNHDLSSNMIATSERSIKSSSSSSGYYDDPKGRQTILIQSIFKVIQNIIQRSQSTSLSTTASGFPLWFTKLIEQKLLNKPGFNQTINLLQEINKNYDYFSSSYLTAYSTQRRITLPSTYQPYSSRFVASKTIMSSTLPPPTPPPPTTTLLPPQSLTTKTTLLSPTILPINAATMVNSTHHNHHHQFQNITTPREQENNIITASKNNGLVSMTGSNFIIPSSPSPSHATTPITTTPKTTTTKPYILIQPELQLQPLLLVSPSHRRRPSFTTTTNITSMLPPLQTNDGRISATTTTTNTTRLNEQQYQSTISQLINNHYMQTRPLPSSLQRSNIYKNNNSSNSSSLNLQQQTATLFPVNINHQYHSKPSVYYRK